jgi:hypothetical protein
VGFFLGTDTCSFCHFRSHHLSFYPVYHLWYAYETHYCVVENKGNAQRPNVLGKSLLAPNLIVFFILCKFTHFYQIGSERCVQEISQDRLPDNIVVEVSLINEVTIVCREFDKCTANIIDDLDENSGNKGACNPTAHKFQDKPPR